MRGKPAEKLRPGTAQSVAEVLGDQVMLELEGIDRMYLNVYVPVLQAVEGVLKFIRIHRGHSVASTAMVEPITRRFVESIECYVPDDLGLRTAYFFTRTYSRILRPGLGSILPELSAPSGPLRRCFDKLDCEVKAWVGEAKLAA